ncbi:MAG: carbohydrate-binding family 9-like protein, partial [Pseudomonadota bacterium]
MSHARSVRLLLATGVVVLLPCVTGCPRPAPAHHSVTLEDGAVKRTPAPAPQGAPLASFEGKIRLLSASVLPAEAAPGDTVTLTLRFEALDNLFDDWRVFVHGQLPGAELTQLQDDHDPLDGKYPTSQWQRGDLVEEQRRLRLPPGLPGRTLQLYVGLYQGEQRLRVDEKDRHDGQNRVPATQVSLRGGRDLPEAVALPTGGSITIDGALNEPGWASAQRLGPFVNYHGRGTPSNGTTARVLYDDKNLYLGFDCQDRDIWTSFRTRDDPIYNEEAVEIFIDVDGDLNTYVELQQSPANVHFDAAFVGRRQNM